MKSLAEVLKVGSSQEEQKKCWEEVERWCCVLEQSSKMEPEGWWSVEVQSGVSAAGVSQC